MEILQIAEWESPATYYEKCEVGDFRLTRTWYREGYYRMWRVNGYTWLRAMKSLPITSLQERHDETWYDWMVDDPFSWLSIKAYCDKLSGRVLTSGLGLGLATYALSENPNVTETVVVERSPEVIELVPTYGATVVNDDFYAYINRDEQFDAVLLDLWVRDQSLVDPQAEAERQLCEEVLPTYLYLKERFPGVTVVVFGFPDACDVSIHS